MTKNVRLTIVLISLLLISGDLVCAGEGSRSLELLEVTFDNSTLTAEVQLRNSSPRPITAYNLALTTRYLDGSSSFRENLEDLVPSIPAANRGLIKKDKYRSVGLLDPGEIRYRTIPADRKPSSQSQSLEVTVDAVVFADGSAEATNLNAVERIFDNRIRWASQYSEWLERIDLAGRGRSSRELVESLSDEIDRLPTNPDRTALQIFKQDVSIGVQAVRSGRVPAEQWMNHYKGSLHEALAVYNQHKVRKGGQR